MFNLLKKYQAPTVGFWFIASSPDGLRISRESLDADWSAESAGLTGLLLQLADDGFAIADTSGTFNLTWDAYFQAAASSDYVVLHDALGLPRATLLRPVLTSRNALADPDFSIALGQWVQPDGRKISPAYLGPILKVGASQDLMTFSQWELIKQVVEFAAREPSQQTQHSQELAWGRLRRTAIAACADMSDFLVKTVVLTPERLTMAFRKSEAVADDIVVEIIPGFDAAPASWIEEFDRFSSVQDRYKFSMDDGGLVQVVVSPAVKAVLEEIKRMPGRRAAGSRAQAFILNPFAALGESVAGVLDETQFEQAREDAGLQFDRFSAVIEHDGQGYPTEAGILIESTKLDGAQTPVRYLFDDQELFKFIDRVERSLKKGLQLIFWDGHEIEILGDTEDQLALLKQAYERRQQPKTLVSYEQIYDLSAYSSRIEGVGVEKPYYSPFIAKRKEDHGWFPENVLPIISYTPNGASEPVTVQISDVALAELTKAIDWAVATGKDYVELVGLPAPMSVQEAEKITKTFAAVLKDIKNGNFVPGPAKTRQQLPRKSLILGANINVVDYDEQRRDALSLTTYQLQTPRSISRDHALMDYQCDGVARMQYLYSLREQFRVRGMVLADDMGLGKTFQLLALMASIFEMTPDTLPMLIVAPVSLLENWKEEAEKFFPGAFRIMTAYGENLRQLRVPRENIDERLRNEDGLVKFLKPDWLGNAQLVLTTYETLRDLEFSFALQHWSIMVCDEAQRIKNPAAMVTRAAKKQNATFKIACTGTPVENTLVDLWCLFDFVQPGLLGALNDFGDKYRRPIEIDERDSEGHARIEELRTRIESQILRRTKLEVAKNLPRKIVDQECRNLPLSTVQRNFYARAISDFKKRLDPAFHTPFKNHLGLLHYLRLVCTDPRRHGLTVFKPDPIREYRMAAPKLDWLLKKLDAIKEKGEKVIVFCEFRNIQRLLLHYISEAVGYAPDIINGDTSASESHSDSRQKRIKAFQARPGFGVIILSPIAVGFGVNIQGANHVVHYTRTWNPAKEDQASDRAWRIGQTKDVYVYYPVVAAEDFTTFDVKLDQLLEKKRSLAGDMLNGSADITTAEFHIEEVVPGADISSIDERVTIDLALRLEWRHFEGMAAALWRKKGFDTVYCTPASGDNGVDVVAIKGNVGELVQVKSSASETRALNWDTVKEVVAGEAFYRRRHPNVVFKKVGLTNQMFNELAHENAKLNQVELIERNQLEALLHQHHVTMLEIERLLYTDWENADCE